MGSFGRILSIQLVERRSGLAGLWKFICRNRLDNDRPLAGRDGFYVSFEGIMEEFQLSRRKGPCGWCTISMVCSVRPVQTKILGPISRHGPFSGSTLFRTGADGLQGWITVFAWITATAASPAYLSNVVQGLVIFNYPAYVPQRWHATLIMWGFIVVPVVWNLWFRRLLNSLEMIGGICHVVFFICSVVTLAVLARRSTADYVFNTLTNDLSGWTNPAVAWGIGLLTVTFPISGKSHTKAFTRFC